MLACKQLGSPHHESVLVTGHGAAACPDAEEVQAHCSAAHLQCDGGCIRLQLPPKLMSALHPLQPLNAFPWLHQPAREGYDLTR